MAYLDWQFDWFWDELGDIPHGHLQKELTDGEARPENGQPHLVGSRCKRSEAEAAWPTCLHSLLLSVSTHC